jgi:hypothetical protein
LALDRYTMAADCTVRFWPPEVSVRMTAEDKLVLRPWGALLLGFNLARLDWALNTVTQPAALAVVLYPLREFSNIHSFEEIGAEATQWHDFLMGLPASPVSSQTLENLKAVRMRWSTLAQERLQGLYLITPVTVLQPKRLMQGIQGFLSEQEIATLVAIERWDLREACACILVGSPTAAERMALRAGESLLRRWYQRTTDKKITRQTWGRVLDMLVKQYPEDSRPKELVLLGYLKERRNELDHPERVSSQSDAETTLMNVFRLIRDLEMPQPEHNGEVDRGRPGHEPAT